MRQSNSPNSRSIQIDFEAAAATGLEFAFEEEEYQLNMTSMNILSTSTVHAN